MNGQVIDSEKIKERFKEYTEILYGRDINIQGALEDILYLQELQMLPREIWQSTEEESAKVVIKSGELHSGQ